MDSHQQIMSFISIHKTRQKKCSPQHERNTQQNIITIFTAHSKQCTAPIYFVQNPIWNTPIDAWSGWWHEKMSTKHNMGADVWQMLITGGSLQSECSARLFDAGKKLVAPLFLSMPALLHPPTNQIYPLVSHYFTPTKIELAGQNLCLASQF